MKAIISTAAAAAALIITCASTVSGQTPTSAAQPAEPLASQRAPQSSSAGYAGPQMAQTTAYGPSLNAPRARTTPYDESAAPVLIRFGSADADTTRNLEEDLSIMSRVIDRALEKSLGEEVPPTTLGVRLLYTSGDRSVRALYLEDFGALFMVRVNFPLLGPPRPETKSQEKSADSEWERARRELAGQGEEETRLDAGVSTAVSFDANQVETLKKVLVQALKNASHIRLHSEESVSLSVFGSPASAMGRFWRSGQASGGGTATASSTPVGMPPGGTAFAQWPGGGNANGFYYHHTAGDAPAGTVLTLRAKKGDIDAFAAGTLSLDAFTAKVSGDTYVGRGYGGTSIHSWLQSGGSASFLRRP